MHDVAHLLLHVNLPLLALVLFPNLLLLGLHDLQLLYVELLRDGRVSATEPRWKGHGRPKGQPRRPHLLSGDGDLVGLLLRLLLDELHHLGSTADKET